MDRAELVGVIGGYGNVGRAAIDHLASWGLGPIRVGGRRPDLALRFVAEVDLGPGAEAVGVDTRDLDSLTRFCEGCRVVVNVSGPSSRDPGLAVRVTLAAGADYVDAGGEVYRCERSLDAEFAQGAAARCLLRA